MRSIDTDEFLDYLTSYAITDEDRRFCDNVAYALKKFSEYKSKQGDHDGWTLCKDKLPERGWYSVTVKGNYPAYTTEAFFDGFNWMNVKNNCVVAWAEQKKPYRGE